MGNSRIGTVVNHHTDQAPGFPIDGGGKARCALYCLLCFLLAACAVSTNGRALYATSTCGGTTNLAFHVATLPNLFLHFGIVSRRLINDLVGFLANEGGEIASFAGGAGGALGQASFSIQAKRETLPAR